MRWRLVTPRSPGGAAAIGVFHLRGDVDAVCAALGVEPMGVGEVRVRSFGDIDRGVAARPAPDALLLMPHAGVAVLRRLEAWLTERGVIHDAPDAVEDEAYPEARTPMEARMLHALARAASPLAIDLLLDQPRRWAAVRREDAETPARSAVLNRLIDPPTVAALGAPNIGKSTLLNALAGRSVSIVADEPGTTRDHVGVRLDLAGLVVNYIDTPGVDEAGAATGIQREAQELAHDVARRADLVLLCADPSSTFLPAGGATLRAGLRSDIGPTKGAEVNVSARTGTGMEELVAMMRERLVPGALVAHHGPWRFW